MSKTIQHENPDALISGPTLQRRIGVTGMTLWRWIQGGKFPTPDIEINRRNYWREGTYAAWFAANQKTKQSNISEGK